MATAEQALQALPLLEERLLQIDPRGRVFIRHDQNGYYFVVQIRNGEVHVMGALPPTFNEVRIAAELLYDAVTSVRSPGDPNWVQTKWGDKHLQAAKIREPIFVLRATDTLADKAIEAWIAAAKEAGVDSLKISRAEQHLAQIKEWRPRALPS